MHQEEDISRASHTVTEPGPLPQEPLPPDTVGGPDQGGHVGLILPDQVGPGQEGGGPGGAVTPVHQLLVPRSRILDLSIITSQCYKLHDTSGYLSHGAQKVSVIHLVADDEIDCGPDIPLCPGVVLQVVGDAQQLEQDAGEAVCGAQVLGLVI